MPLVPGSVGVPSLIADVKCFDGLECNLREAAPTGVPGSLAYSRYGLLEENETPVPWGGQEVWRLHICFPSALL